MGRVLVCGLDGAEAILSLRAVIGNGDFEEYWRFHLKREHSNSPDRPASGDTRRRAWQLSARTPLLGMKLAADAAAMSKTGCPLRRC